MQVRAHADSDHFTGRSGKAELEGNRPVPHNGRHRVGSLDRKNRVQFSATASVTLANPTPAFNKVINEVFC